MKQTPKGVLSPLSHPQRRYVKLFYWHSAFKWPQFPVFPAKCMRLAVTIWAQDAQIINPVVKAIPVYVIHLEPQWQFIPFR
jgi:hypothetical protein